MRKLVLLLWLMLPLLVGFYHAGPGQQRVVLDETEALIQRAEQHRDAEEWGQAVEAYARALQLLPAERIREGRRLRLERAKAQMLASQLPAAHEDLRALVDELKADPAASPELLAETRTALANSKYYLTWLMRLEGQPKERWEPEIEAARQTYRLLAEQAEQGGDETKLQGRLEDLESAIRLARMDLSDLQGLPLPSQ